MSSGGQPSLPGQSTSLHVNHFKASAALLPQNNTSGGELNLVWFGLKETSLIVVTKDVEEILTFIAGRPIPINDILDFVN